jgi:3-deoxy-D-manno-octulosonic-acid transferase
LVAQWNPKAKRWVEGRKGLFKRLENAFSQNKAPIIWLHCSSLGEFEQGRPVLEKIRKSYPSHKILLSFFSPSGYEVKKDYPGADYIFYLPADSKKNAKRFIQIVNPQLVLWVKYDYWYFYLAELKQKSIPALLISGAFRKDQPFFKWYGRLHRYMLECFLHLFVQTEESAQLLQQTGLGNNITVSGDTRFDRVLEIATNFEPMREIEKFCGNDPVIVAGSTWAEDEEELDHFANTHPHIKFIVAPHDVTEERLKEAEELFVNCTRYSKLILDTGSWKAPQPISSMEHQASSIQQLSSSIQQQNSNVLLIDNIGMLSRLYKYATITYVGGGFGNDGVHNVLEAAVYGKPIIFGPEYEKYIEAIDLVEKGAAYSIDSAVEIEKLMNDLLSDTDWLKESSEAARNYVYSKKGATDKIMHYIQENRLLIS